MSHLECYVEYRYEEQSHKNRKKIRKCLLCHKKRTFTSKPKVTYSRAGDLECEDLRENQIETRLLTRSCSFACCFLPEFQHQQHFTDLTSLKP